MPGRHKDTQNKEEKGRKEEALSFEKLTGQKGRWLVK